MSSGRKPVVREAADLISRPLVAMGTSRSRWSEAVLVKLGCVLEARRGGSQFRSGAWRKHSL